MFPYICGFGIVLFAFVGYSLCRIAGKADELAGRDEYAIRKEE